MEKDKKKFLAKDFLESYQDPEISKKLCFEVWADRVGVPDQEKAQLWLEIRRLTYKIVGKKISLHHQKRFVSEFRFNGEGPVTSS